MSKITLLYDVAKRLKAKEVLTGILHVEVEKDQTTLFSMQNEFEKNLSTGQTKAKVTAQVDYEGTLKKHDDFKWGVPCLQGRKHHEWLRHHHDSHAGFCGGLKEKFFKIAFGLSIVDSMQVEEQDDKSIVISLNANNLPDDIKQLLQEKMTQAGACQHHGHHLFKELMLVDNPQLLFAMYINQDGDMEKLVITASGTETDAQAKQHEIKAAVDLSFAG